MPRTIALWVGKTDDTPAPEKVQLRVLDSQCEEPGALPICPDCGLPIVPGRDKAECDHRVPLIDGGPNAEDNLQMLHAKCHRLRTARQAMERAEVRAKRKKAFGITAQKRPWGYRPMRQPFRDNTKYLDENDGNSE
jgi:5-methylcytosine-specific restriction endonuclease McrA